MKKAREKDFKSIIDILHNNLNRSKKMLLSFQKTLGQGELFLHGALIILKDTVVKHYFL